MNVETSTLETDSLQVAAHRFPEDRSRRTPTMNCLQAQPWKFTVTVLVYSCTRIPQQQLSMVEEMGLAGAHLWIYQMLHFVQDCYLGSHPLVKLYSSLVEQGVSGSPGLDCGHVYHE